MLFKKMYSKRRAAPLKILAYSKQAGSALLFPKMYCAPLKILTYSKQAGSALLFQKMHSERCEGGAQNASKAASEGAALAQWHWVAMLRRWHLQMARCTYSLSGGEWVLRVPSVTWVVPTPAAHLQVISAAVAAVQPARMRTQAVGAAAPPYGWCGCGRGS